MPVSVQYVSVTTYTEMFSVDRDTVYKWIDAGLLDTFRVGRLIRVRPVPPSDTRPSLQASA